MLHLCDILLQYVTVMLHLCVNIYKIYILYVISDVDFRIWVWQSVEDLEEQL